MRRSVDPNSFTISRAARPIIASTEIKRAIGPEKDWTIESILLSHSQEPPLANAVEDVAIKMQQDIIRIFGSHSVTVFFIIYSPQIIKKLPTDGSFQSLRH